MSQGSYGRSVLISIAAVVAMSVMAMANNIVIARLTGPEGRGLYGVAVAIGALAMPLASVGLGQAATWQLGRGRQFGELLDIGRKTTLISLALAALTAAVVSLGFRLSWSETALWSALAAGVALPAQITIELGRGLALGERRPVAYNLSSIAVITAFLTLNLVTAARGPTWVLINLVAANWLIALVMVGLSLRRPRMRADAALVRESLTYGWRSAVVALGDAALLRIDYLLAAPIIGLVNLGIYAIADQISHLMAWAGLLAGKMMLPEAASDDDGQRSWIKLGLACRLLIAVLILGSLFAAAVGPWLIVALFGADFAPAYWAMLILLPATLSKSLHALVSTWLQGRGVQSPIVRASAAAVGAEAVLVVTAALTLGWLGVALAKTFAYVVQLGLVLRAARVHRRELGLEDHAHLLPDGRWLLGRDDLDALRRWLDARRKRSTPPA